MSRAQSQEHKVLEATRIDDEPTLPNGAPEPSTRCPLREASLRETISRLNSSILIEERLKSLQRKKSGLEEKIVTLGRDRARLELDIPCYEQMLAVDTTEDLLLPLTKSSLKKFLSELSTIIGRDVSAFVSCERAPQSTIDEWIRKDYTPQIGQNLLVIHEIDKNPENRARVHRAKQYHGERNTELEKLGEALNGSILFLGETNNPTPLPEDSLQQAKILLR
ncbi:MAG: hypothetical protein KDD70_11170, partial [Bdellovibrionales bacterium]|nr:hypothetical protein [Bdellovibrionales bacterium]